MVRMMCTVRMVGAGRELGLYKYEIAEVLGTIHT